MTQNLPRALVIGVNGQDGSYMAEHLLKLGWLVSGIGRQTGSRFVAPNPRYSYVNLDLTHEHELAVLLDQLKPQRIYHFAAIHGASGFAYEEQWQAALRVNVGSVHKCLEFARKSGEDVRLFYASSVKAFDSEPPAVVHEALARKSTCLYSITKNASVDLLDYYRKMHGVRATAAFFFNHESPRRPGHFFLPRLSGILARALANGTTQDVLRSLDFACDWGSSAEYMQISHDLLEHSENQDYVIATGKTWTGLDVTEALFSLAGLDWRDHVKLQAPPGSSPTHMFQADTSRLGQTLNRFPAQNALDVALWILRENHGITIDRPTETARRTP
jgi:GDPmannose 4,6-dehydratase